MDFIHDVKNHLRKKLGLPTPAANLPMVIPQPKEEKVVDIEHKENVEYYLAGQPTDDVITFGQEEVGAMTAVAEGKHLPVEEIERRAKAIVAARIINADYNNSFDINHSAAIGCTKAVNGCCMAYLDPTVLAWHRHGKTCALGKLAGTAKPKQKVRVGQQKQAKRKNK